jgi:hypothetical protein
LVCNLSETLREKLVNIGEYYTSLFQSFGHIFRLLSFIH